MELTREKTTTKAPEPDPQDPAMVLTHADLDLINRSLHANIASRDKLLSTVSDLATISVHGVSITLEPKLLTRLKSRCLDKSAWPKWLEEVVVKQLHDFAGW